MCRAYGVLPHELPPKGTPERAFLVEEWRQRAEEAEQQDGFGGPAAPGGSGSGPGGNF